MFTYLFEYWVTFEADIRSPLLEVILYSVLLFDNKIREFRSETAIIQAESVIIIPRFENMFVHWLNHVVRGIPFTANTCITSYFSEFFLRKKRVQNTPRKWSLFEGLTHWADPFVFEKWLFKAILLWADI